MLCVIFFIFVSVIGLSIGAVMLCVLAEMGCEFFPFLAYLTETAVSVVLIWEEIAVYIFRSFLDVADSFLKLCLNLTVICTRTFRHACSTFPYIMKEGAYHINVAKDVLGDFVSNNKESIILCWGLLLITLFVFSNILRTRDRGNDMNNDDDYVQDSDAEVDRDRRIQNSHIDSDNNSSNAGIQNESMTCVVCYINDRNTALFPCGHAQTCLQCTRNIMTTNKRCPLCYSDVQEYRTIYL